LCKHCGECSHIQRNCPAHKEETARKEYGDYFHEIIEGRNTRDNSSLDDETERKDTSGQADSNPTTDDNNSVNVLLGASNCKRLRWLVLLSHIYFLMLHLKLRHLCNFVKLS
jgi:hypothetical protein